MLDLRKLLSRDRRRTEPTLEAESDYPSSKHGAEGLEVEYHHLVTSQLRRWSINPEHVDVQIRKLGTAPDGYEVFVAMVRLTEWHRASALRLLVGLPLLEKKVRRNIVSTWLADVSHFSGLWVHASDTLQLGDDTDELRGLLGSLKVPVPLQDSMPVNDSTIDSEPATLRAA